MNTIAMLSLTGLVFADGDGVDILAIVYMTACRFSYVDGVVILVI